MGVVDERKEKGVVSNPKLKLQFSDLLRHLSSSCSRLLETDIPVTCHAVQSMVHLHQSPMYVYRPRPTGQRLREQRKRL
jgi:hypothetical protein